MSLRLTCARLAARRSQALLAEKAQEAAKPAAAAAAPKEEAKPAAAAAPKSTGPKQAFGYGDVAPANAPGFKPYQEKPPETVGDTVKYIAEGTFKPPLKKEIIEAIGYPGQKHSHGGITTVGRIYYGPGRYDYGRPKMPEGWFANWFYGFWEFGHLMFVADRWIFFRQIRHLVFTGICFFPMWLTIQWNVKLWEDFKKVSTE